MSESHTVAFIDLGTNSVRLLIGTIEETCSFTLLRREKEIVRLGEREFGEHLLHEEAIARAVLVCQNFAKLAQTYGAEEIIIVATSATRDARNQEDLIERVRAETGLEINVISGREEARLTYLGVRSSVDFEDKSAMMIDIGGGSTEIAIGDKEDYSGLWSFQIGAMRLTSKFQKDGGKGPVRDSTYNKMRKYARTAIGASANSIKKKKWDMTFGGSGTITNLADISSKAYGSKEGTLKYTNVKKISAMLRAMPLEERKKVPGINPERADIIIAGTAILETIMEEFGISELRVTDKGVKDGMVADYLLELKECSQNGSSAREVSVEKLGKACGIDEKHAQTVVRLALELFDSARSCELHKLGEDERELLRYAAYLHDIGEFISFNNRREHSYYLIMNADLLGFNKREITIIAETVLHQHRRQNIVNPQTVLVLSSLLKLAESLDRSRNSVISSVVLQKDGKNAAVLKAVAQEDATLEKWGVETARKTFQRAFNRELRIKIKEQ
ncbi:Ppx/GppA phosphatase family protein [Candidatus Methanomassiliicoccus intestinalis]|uniref:Ppx/GppA phosphatase family protein n=2 Tax=Candidatus Methanomassiliicoccus intestinalis TaxID=1406512 RepID=UPI0037DC5D29